MICLSVSLPAGICTGQTPCHWSYMIGFVCFLLSIFIMYVQSSRFFWCRLDQCCRDLSHAALCGRHPSEGWMPTHSYTCSYLCFWRTICGLLSCIRDMTFVGGLLCAHLNWCPYLSNFEVAYMGAGTFLSLKGSKAQCLAYCTVSISLYVYIYIYI